LSWDDLRIFEADHHLQPVELDKNGARRLGIFVSLQGIESKLTAPLESRLRIRLLPCSKWW
jgi:hypothetical protein